MSNPMKYIKDLEAAGFHRAQAEAQVQMVLDVLEGDLVTKNDFVILKNDIAIFREHVDNKFAQVESRFRDQELRMVVKLGIINASTVAIGVAILAWLR